MSTGIPHSGKVKAPQDVWDFIDEQENRLKREYLGLNADDVTYAELAKIYLEAGGSPRFQAKLINEIGHFRRADLTQDFIDRKAREIYGHCTPETINRQFYTPFIAVWNHNTSGTSPLCPIVNWNRPKANKKKKKAAIKKSVSYNDAATFINTLSDATAKVMFFSFWTGMRPMEIITLEDTSINLGGRWIVLDDTKTDEPRGVPIHEGLVPLLSRELEKTGRIFRNSHGRPWPENRLYNKQGRLVAQRGGQMQSPINTARAKTGLDITLYTARHTVSTHLIYPCLVDKVIKDEILGHGETSDISLNYIHLPRQAHIDAINKLPSPSSVGVRKDFL